MITFDAQLHDPLLLVRGPIGELPLDPRDVAEQLADAARSERDGVFAVSADEVLRKILDAPSLAFAVQERRVVAFMALDAGTVLPRTRLTFAYVQGVLVHAEHRGQDLPFRLLTTALGLHGWPDLVALHTQTPAMVACIQRWGRGVCFPRMMGAYTLTDELSEDLAERMTAIGRRVGEAGTGICRDEYPHRLYQGDLGQLGDLGDRDALFMVGFTGRGSARGLHLRGWDA